jgi:hypothetical protein
MHSSPTPGGRGGPAAPIIWQHKSKSECQVPGKTDHLLLLRTVIDECKAQNRCSLVERLTIQADKRYGQIVWPPFPHPTNACSGGVLYGSKVKQDTDGQQFLKPFRMRWITHERAYPWIQAQKLCCSKYNTYFTAYPLIEAVAAWLAKCTFLMVVKWNSSVLTMNQNSHRLLFILNRYLVMRGECDTHTPHHPLFFCGKLCSYWSTAQRCERWGP